MSDVSAAAGLAGFLLDRYREEKSEAQAAHDVPGSWYANVARVGAAADRDHIARHDPARDLADLDAKRRIVEEHCWDASLPQRPNSQCPTCLVYQPCPTLRLLALPYVSHPEWRAEWLA